LSEDVIAEIRAAVEREGKIEREFAVEVKDENGEVVAEVTKVLYVRKKEKSQKVEQ
jgi:acyl-coenzyme A thioesterase PaaI-like protein